MRFARSVTRSRIAQPQSVRTPARGQGSAVPARPPLHLYDSFLNGTNASYLEEMFHEWKSDPNSVPAELTGLFEKMSSLDASEPIFSSYSRPPSFIPGMDVGDAGAGSAAGSSAHAHDNLRVMGLIRSYQKRGHIVAAVDPLNLPPLVSSLHKPPPDLDPAFWGLTADHMDRTFIPNTHPLQKGFLGPGSVDRIPLKDLITLLQRTYTRSIGWEFGHLTNPHEVAWLLERIETPQAYRLDNDTRKRALADVVSAQLFEEFCGSKFMGHKRFGLDGAESLVAGMNAMMDLAADMGVVDAVLGMPHRGRLNVLRNVLTKPGEAIFSEFKGGLAHLPEDASGDVKYHLGVSRDKPCRPDGKILHVSLLANPSHLEAVNPLVMGKSRAKMDIHGDRSGGKVLPILLHGDAAYSGQGIVFECNAMASLEPYTNHGTIQVVVNNQIGFTAMPSESRSMRYSTGAANALEVPVFHVNGDDVDAVVQVFRVALEYRMKFQKDCVIDLVCYRRYGHNENDEPLFTNPLMYQKIAKHPKIVDLYSSRLQTDGVVSPAETLDMIKGEKDGMAKDLEDSKSYKPKVSDWLESKWKGFRGRDGGEQRPTAISREVFDACAKVLGTKPEGIRMHPTLAKTVDARATQLSQGPVAWPTAELLAFGSLAQEGNHIRLSGQDSERGTFSQRHAVVHCQKSYQKIVPLQQLGSVEIYNSPLSEFGVLGFELGYALESPRQLIVWEAQFGDFANNAQCIFDQFLASGEDKWLRQNGLVVLLPHGFDGQGPEHSSARLERFLQMCNSTEERSERSQKEVQHREQHSNWQIVFCSTAANHFHVLRRQLCRDFRKPLICFVSKSCLRKEGVASPVEDFLSGSFKPVIGSTRTDDAKVKRHIFCTGQLYYNLDEYRTQQNLEAEVAITRLEQLSPFPWEEVEAEMQRYPNAEAVVWAQEEPRNNGAWSFVQPRLRQVVPQGMNLQYVGRQATGSVATGYMATHQREMQSILRAAFGQPQAELEAEAAK
eukprot:TRINITY_DN3907_c0_g2_i1.p1 TRINITY_DN3907_c0_g2~~TRINITY_DN3907_c0_g2_i1.p1  ORF type:complete len:1005 (-),score=295.77 TRINITY_DN3907_c0_g2_i1:412-3426(-)